MHRPQKKIQPSNGVVWRRGFRGTGGRVPPPATWKRVQVVPPPYTLQMLCGLPALGQFAATQSASFERGSASYAPNSQRSEKSPTSRVHSMRGDYSYQRIGGSKEALGGQAHRFATPDGSGAAGPEAAGWVDPTSTPPPSSWGGGQLKGQKNPAPTEKGLPKKNQKASWPMITILPEGGREVSRRLLAGFQPAGWTPTPPRGGRKPLGWGRAAVPRMKG